jgi:hypothetical protein
VAVPASTPRNPRREKVRSDAIGFTLLRWSLHGGLTPRDDEIVTTMYAARLPPWQSASAV